MTAFLDILLYNLTLNEIITIIKFHDLEIWMDFIHFFFFYNCLFHIYLFFIKLFYYYLYTNFF